MKKGFWTLGTMLIGTVVGAGASIVMVGKDKEASINKWQEMSNKHLELFLLMDQWVALKQEGKELYSFFEKNNYHTIAIYGMSYVGMRLIEELKGSGITIKYGIDKNAEEIYSDLEIVNIDDELENVDAIIVTPIYFFDEIEEELSVKIDCPIISIQEIIDKTQWEM